MSNPTSDFETPSDDETTIDPEATSAADSEWLAELRAKAKAGKQSMGDLLANAPEPASRLPNPEPIDEPTIAPDDNVMDSIRLAVAEARTETNPPPSTPVVAAPPAPVPTSTRAAAPAESAAPLVPAPIPERVPSSGVRWEPPQRLAPVVEVEKPTLGGNATSSNTSRLIAVLGAVAVVTIIVLAALLLRGSDDPPPVPDGSIPVVDGDVDLNPDAEPQQPEADE